MDAVTRKRIYNVLGAMMEARNPEFRKLWENVFNDLIAPYNEKVVDSSVSSDGRTGMVIVKNAS